MIETTNITISKTARYSSIGTISTHTRHVWLICHGYGHLSRFFLRKFEALADGETVLIAPEGLHRFYLNGVSGRVGASWMTKEERLADIDDYVAYLDQVYETLILPHADHIETITCLGFSQGGATASRWVTRTKHRIDHIVLWASVFPPDMNSMENAAALNRKKLFLVIGDQDEYVEAGQKKEHLDQLSALGIKYQLMEFAGTHDIDKPTLIELKHRLYAG